jgi:small-conductance mechanosensitive channel
MACFFRTFTCSQGALKEKMRVDELESALMMLTAQLEAEKSEKAILEEQLSQAKTEADSLRESSSSLRAAASTKMQRWFGASPKTHAEPPEYAIYTEDGGSEKSCTESTADDSEPEQEDSGSDTERRGSESTSEEESKDARTESALVDARP